MSLRIRILRAIERAPATADEIASVTKDDRKRIISNMGSICTDGIVQRISGVDGTIEYKLTAAGKAYLARNAPFSSVDRESVQAQPSADPVVAPAPSVDADQAKSQKPGDDCPAAGSADAALPEANATSCESEKPAVEAVHTNDDEIEDDPLSPTPRTAPRGYVISHPTEGLMSSTFDTDDDQYNVMSYAADLCRDSGVSVEVYRFEAVLVGKYVPSAVFIAQPEEALA